MLIFSSNLTIQSKIQKYLGELMKQIMHGKGTNAVSSGQSWKGELKNGSFSSNMKNSLKT